MIRNDLLLEANKLSGYMARIGAAGIGVDLTRASGLEVMAAVPELKAELRACKRAEDFEAVFKKRGPAIEAHMHVMAEAARQNVHA